jgi:hypothetical protein
MRLLKINPPSKLRTSALWRTNRASLRLDFDFAAYVILRSVALNSKLIVTML